jgi:molybdopterin molybdotransferase
LIKKNEKIDFIKIALLSSVGITNLWVYKTLRVAVVSSGNELIKSGKKIKDHQVYDSNKYQIIHFLKKFNISVHDLGIIKDDEIKVDKFYKKNQNKFDIIISSGGSSFSSKDYISSFLSQNTELLFKYVRIQPGRPVIFSKLKFNYYFSLPGNPLAVFTNLFFLVSLFIDPSRKDNSSITKFYQSGFSENKKSNLTKFYRVKLSKNILYTHNSKGSAKLISLSEADGLAFVPEGNDKIKKGEKIRFIEF